eukprot:1063480-Pleurochrysis_carterae.AAC.2
MWLSVATPCGARGRGAPCRAWRTRQPCRHLAPRLPVDERHGGSARQFAIGRRQRGANTSAHGVQDEAQWDLGNGHVQYELQHPDNATEERFTGTVRTDPVTGGPGQPQVQQQTSGRDQYGTREKHILRSLSSLSSIPRL